MPPGTKQKQVFSQHLYKDCLHDERKRPKKSKLARLVLLCWGLVSEEKRSPRARLQETPQSRCMWFFCRAALGDLSEGGAVPRSAMLSNSSSAWGFLGRPLRTSVVCFSTLTRNIRHRRGEKVVINVPSECGREGQPLPRCWRWLPLTPCSLLFLSLFLLLQSLRTRTPQLHL